MMNVSVNFADEQNDLYPGLQRGSAAEILQVIGEIYTLLSKAGVPVRPYTKKGLAALALADEDKKQRILTDLNNWKAILQSSEVTLDKVDEHYLAQKALKHFKFKLKKHDWAQSAADEIIEIYNPQGVQIYRSLNFFGVCGYSLLDLCVHEWWILWERPKSVINSIHNVVTSVLSGEKQDSAVNIDSHLIRETYDDGTTQPFLPRITLVNFGDIYPAYCSDSNEIIGFVITSKGKLLSVGADADAVDFI